MTVTPSRMSVLDLYRLPGHVRWRRWRTGSGGGWSEVHVTLGYLPDGRWWVESTGDTHIWVFGGDEPHEVRAAARIHLGELMRGRRWRRTIATYEPGTAPAREAQVPQWPPGFEPGQP